MDDERDSRRIADEVIALQANKKGRRKKERKENVRTNDSLKLRKYKEGRIRIRERRV